MFFFLPCLSLSTLLFYYVTPYVVLVGKHWKTVFQCVAAPAASSIFLNAVEITIIWNPDVEKTLSLWITKWAGQSRRMGTMAGRWSEGQRWKRKEKKREEEEEDKRMERLWRERGGKGRQRSAALWGLWKQQVLARSLTQFKMSESYREQLWESAQKRETPQVCT